MVMQSLHEKRESDDHDPIELAPLYFNLDQNSRYSATDINPLLIAVEFALQGRTVHIQSDHDNNPFFSKSIRTIQKLMLDMGVPGDRISISDMSEPPLAQHANTDPKGWEVNFKAL